MESVDVVQNAPNIWPQVVQLAAVFAAFLAAVAAYLAARDSKRAADIGERHSSQSMTNEILQMHINFQSEIRGLQKILPPEVNDAG
jgi:Flp pilus assembly protein TadB